MGQLQRHWLIFSSYLGHSLQVLLWATFCLSSRTKQGSQPASVVSISLQMGHGPLFPGLTLTNNHASAVVMCLYMALDKPGGKRSDPGFRHFDHSKPVTYALKTTSLNKPSINHYNAAPFTLALKGSTTSTGLVMRSDLTRLWVHFLRNRL
jgi:hypothetical protein